MTAEELFAGWLDKQDYWLKALYVWISLDFFTSASSKVIISLTWLIAASKADSIDKLLAENKA